MAESRRVRRTSIKRQGWLRSYQGVLKAWTPDQCARCGRPGDGWVNHGAANEAHHLMRRTTEWKMCVVAPLCGGPDGCHHWVENNTKKAIEDGWLVSRTRDKFDRDVMDAEIERLRGLKL